MTKPPGKTRADKIAAPPLEEVEELPPELEEDSDVEELELLRELRARGKPPDSAEIEDQRRYLVERQQRLAVAAEWVSRELSAISWVRRVVLFGSVANPLKEEVPRFREFRKWRIKLPHECNDVDLAVWLDKFTDLRSVQRAKSRALAAMAKPEGFNFATHQVDMFLHNASNIYAGRLCQFNACPKGKLDCNSKDCGSIPFLKQIPGFKMYATALAPNRSRVLYERS